jgi:O-antigen biosynthesis protein
VGVAVKTDLEALRHYLSRALLHSDDRVLDRVVLRTASRRSLDLLALYATGGNLVFDDLMQHIVVEDLSKQHLDELAGGRVFVARLLRAIRAYALLELSGEDTARALQMFQWVYREYGPAVFNSERRHLFQNLAYAAGDFELAYALFKSHGKADLESLRVMEADLVNPYGLSPYAAPDRWHHLFGLLLGGRRLVELRVSESAYPSLPPFDRIRTEVRESINEGPLVTVIVTSWKPGEELQTAVQSILSQSWRNLEVLIIDDASPAEYQDLLTEIAQSDPRVRLVRQERNGGTYLARNVGLSLARGEFVTGQDSDDWSHPLRIETQVSKMLAVPHLMSTVSRALRCDERLVFNQPGSQAARENASSLMFRREPVMSRIGFYDSVRKGADTEYMLRLRKMFGAQSHYAVPQNLALIRRLGDSLSNADFRPGWRHASRWAYRRNYEYWHRNEHDTGQLKLGPVSDERRPFPAPARFLDTDTYDREIAKPLDVLFMEDLRRHTDERSLFALRDEILACLASGLSVGVVHVRSFRDVTQAPIDPLWSPIQAMIHSGRLREVLLADPVATSAVIVRRPEVALFADGEPCRIRASHVVVVAEEGATDASGRTWYDPAVCDSTLRALFNIEPEWAAPAAVAKSLRGKVSRIAPRKYPLIADLSRWKTPLRNFTQRNPVIGRVVEDLPGELPKSPRYLRKAYPVSSDIQVRLLNGREHVSAILKERGIPCNWIFHSHSDTEYGAFLSGCDFYVHFDEGAREAPSRTIAQALAAGCVVIASPEHAAPYQGAVIGAAKHQVREIVERLSQAPRQHLEQVRRGMAYIRAHHSNERLEQWLATYMPRSTRAPVVAAPSPGPWIHTRPVFKDYLRRSTSSAQNISLDDALCRMASLDGRELLAWAASSGRAEHAQIVELCRQYRDPQTRQDAARELYSMEPTPLLRLARIMTLQTLQPDDRENCLSIVQAVLEEHGPVPFSKPWATIFIDTAIALRRGGLAHYLLGRLKVAKSERARIETDLANPSVGQGAEAEWLERFNQRFVDHGLEPFSLLEQSGERFDRLLCQAPVGLVDGPLVTVVVTTWCPGPGLLNAVSSLLNQTWRNLEILIVDDASPPSFAPLLERCAAMDARIRVLAQEVNQGTYAARNLAMSEAKGTFLTVQDSDDFSHPRRIELQLVPLLENPSLMATLSTALRVNGDMVQALPGTKVTRPNASSLTIRLKEVVEKVGYFDTSRKAADSEYAIRIGIAFDAPILEVLPEKALALVRLDERSLSRLEFKPGWRHPARTSYRESYEYWHTRIIAGDELPRVLPWQRPRPYPVPQRFAAAEEDRVARTIDVVLLADWREDAASFGATFEHLSELVRRGLKVAICHQETLWSMERRRRAVSSRVRSLIHQGAISELIAGDDAIVGVLVVADPVLLQFTPAQPLGWTIGTAVVLAAIPPHGLNNTGHVYDVMDCCVHAREMLGLDCMWLPLDPAAQNTLADVIPQGLLGETVAQFGAGSAAIADLVEQHLGVRPCGTTNSEEIS